MSYCEIISCRIAIQVCIGYLPNGIEQHRTFSIKGINPDASPEAIAAVVRALAPVLAYPITKVRKVVKRTIDFDDWKAPTAPAPSVSLPAAPAVVPAASGTSPLVQEGGEEEKIFLMLLAFAWLRQWAYLRQWAWVQLALLSLCARAVEFARVRGVSGRSPP